MAENSGEQDIVYQQQMQVLMAQKETLSLQLMELNKSLDELEKAKPSDEIYRMSGPLLIKSSKSETKKDLEEKKELIQKRLTTIESNEKRLLDKLKGGKKNPEPGNISAKAGAA